MFLIFRNRANVFRDCDRGRAPRQARPASRPVPVARKAKERRPITSETSVASIKTATAKVNPIILTTRKLPEGEMPQIPRSIDPRLALVIRPAVLARPSGSHPFH